MKTKDIHIRVGEVLKIEIEKSAVDEGLSVSAYLVHLHVLHMRSIKTD